jgi:hypothetical protein
MKEFYCHRVLLAAQSSRFAKIFKKKTFTVKILGVQCMDLILRFIQFVSVLGCSRSMLLCEPGFVHRTLRVGNSFSGQYIYC